MVMRHCTRLQALCLVRLKNVPISTGLTKYSQGVKRYNQDVDWGKPTSSDSNVGLKDRDSRSDMRENTRGARKSVAMDVTERREVQRFRVDWAVRVSVMVADGSPSEKTGTLRDISSKGAYGVFTNRFEIRPSVKVIIRLPLWGEKWMSYPATVLRVEPLGLGAGIAFSFDAVRPSFGGGDLDRRVGE